jgi:hypothetical protein
MPIADEIADEIIEIMDTYDRQKVQSGYVDTPGGLEHMGDVWGMLDRWRNAIRNERSK